jgi:3-methyladenine DNA glycosylase AlkD
MDVIEKLIQRAQKTQHGFLDIQKAANEVVDEQPAEDSLRIAKQLFKSEIYQARLLATFIFGRLAANSNETIEFLKRHVSQDNDWRVQEILAKAFVRIWTGRPFFCDHPEVAIQLLSQLRNDESEYVRKSVGNALRDISKKHKELVKIELHQWNITNKHIKQTHNLANKFLQHH